jgi:hypothetical protein
MNESSDDNELKILYKHSNRSIALRLFKSAIANPLSPL